MNNNYDIILDTYNTLIFMDNDSSSIYFILKWNELPKIKILNTVFSVPTPDELEEELKDILHNSGLTQEEINQEIEELKDTEFYKNAIEYFEDEESIENIELPTDELLDLDLFENYKNDDELDELISDYLSNKYGYCINGYNYRLTETHVIVDNIEWDLDE